MLKPLTTLVAAVRGRDAKARFIFVGDYVNRGSRSKGVIDFLLQLENASFIRGNHDDIFDLVINGECYAENAARGDRVAAFQWFMKYGLDSTLLSYDIDFAQLDLLTERCHPDQLDRIGRQIPAAHRQFIRNLPAVHEEEDLFVVHGKWEPDELSEAPTVGARLAKNFRIRHSVLWGRFTSEEIGRAKAWGRTGFFGHTPVSYYAGPAEQPQMLPVVGRKMVLVDTAAALGEDGRLTAYCADDESFIQTDHFGELVANEK